MGQHQRRKFKGQSAFWPEVRGTPIFGSLFCPFLPLFGSFFGTFGVLFRGPKTGNINKNLFFALFGDFGGTFWGPFLGLNEYLGTKGFHENVINDDSKI
jgi:hypothetical protein